MSAGIVIVWSGFAPMLRVLRSPVELGRDMFPEGNDGMSRRHTRIAELVVSDQESRNGTFVNGKQVSEVVGKNGTVVRAYRVVGVLYTDVTPFERDWTSGGPLSPPHVVRTIVETVQRLSPSLRVHATFVERCLVRAYPTEAELVNMIARVAERCQAQKQDTLTGTMFDEIRVGDAIDAGDEPEKTVIPRATTDYGKFVSFFQRVMKERPPFGIPDDYHVLSIVERNGQRVEVMIGGPVGPALLVQADAGHAETMPVGWFQAGFWGHGLNSYAVYYGRATERSRVYLRLSYGEGVYESDPDGARARALATMKKYIKLADTLPCTHVTLVQSMDGAHWRIEKLDGTVVEMPHPKDEYFSSLDSFDFEQLAK